MREIFEYTLDNGATIKVTKYYKFMTADRQILPIDEILKHGLGLLELAPNKIKMVAIAMKDSSNKLALLGLTHCLIGFFATPTVVCIFYILYGLSDSNPDFILPTILIISYCICLFWSGICMEQRKNYRFSFAIAWIGLILLSIPTYGLTAVLGLITIYILTEDSVKTLYKSK